MIFSAPRLEAMPPWARNLASLTRQGRPGEVPAQPPAVRCDGTSPGLPPASRLSPLFPRLEQSFAQLAFVLRGRVEARGVGQLVEAGEAEEAFEQLRRLEQGGAELGAARLLDQAALGQRLHGRLRGDAADPRHLGPGDGLQV